MSQIPGGTFGYHQYYKHGEDDNVTLSSGKISDEGSRQSTIVSLKKKETRYDYDQNSILADDSRDITNDNRSAYTSFSGTDYTTDYNTKFSRSGDGFSTVISETTGTQFDKGPTQYSATTDFTNIKGSIQTPDTITTNENVPDQLSGCDLILPKSETSDQTIDSDGDNNVLHYRISRGEWKEVGKIMMNPQGKVMASNTHPNGFGDYPLHLILDFQVNFEARAKAMKVYKEEQKRLDMKEDAREIRERRRKEGEDVDTVYDSDEWTSSGSEDASDDDDDDDDDKVDSSVERSMPPATVVLAVLKACPSACKVRGYNSRYPLHHATRMHHSKEVIEAIIRQYPQALNMQDNQKKTPRDFEERSKGDPHLHEINAMMDRPASCWLQNIRDEEIGDNLDIELNSLEKEVGGLMIEYEKVMADERSLLERMAEIDRVSESFDKFRENQDLDGRVAKLQNSLDTELFRVKDKLEKLIGQAELKYADDEKEGKYITGFNEDVIKIYQNAQDEINELKEEISNMKLCITSDNQ